jgi:hypothetical protein
MKAAGDLGVLCDLLTRATLVLTGRCASTVERAPATVRERRVCSRAACSEAETAAFEILETRVAVVLPTVVVDEASGAEFDMAEEDTDAVVGLEIGIALGEIVEVDTGL